jgi:hypothetical protein
MGLCLLKSVKELPDNVKRLRVFSKNAGAQYKNKHILKIWSDTVDNTHIETADHKFLISHNSFIEWDLNFDVIENAKKSNEYVFVPDDWLQIVYKACKYFTVVNMTNEEVESMNAVIKDGVKGVQHIQWFQF